MYITVKVSAAKENIPVLWAQPRNYQPSFMYIYGLARPMNEKKPFIINIFQQQLPNPNIFITMKLRLALARA